MWGNNQQGQPQQWVPAQQSQFIPGDVIDMTEPYVLRVVGFILLVISFLWSIIGFNGGWTNTFPATDVVTGWSLAGGYVSSPEIFWSGHVLNLRIIWLLVGVWVQSACTYVEWTKRHYKQGWPYRIALVIDVIPSTITSWTLASTWLIGIIVAVHVPALVAWLFTGILILAINVELAREPEQLLVK